MEIKDRIEQFRIANSMTVQAFEEKCCFSNGSWAKSGDLSERFLIRFVKAFPNVSTDWILKGEESAQLDDSRNEDVKMHELLSLCKSLVSNYQQRDEIMGQLVSMVKPREKKE